MALTGDDIKKIAALLEPIKTAWGVWKHSCTRAATKCMSRTDGLCKRDGDRGHDELEKVLSRVAALVDRRKTELIQMVASPEDGVPWEYVKGLSKGELVAEAVYLDFRGHHRNRIEWY